MNTTKTLHCKAGNHDWQRPIKRGRVPENCPDHSAPKSERAEGEPKRVRIITERKPRVAKSYTLESILLNRNGCTCDLRPDMTSSELRHIESCTPYFICPTLDRARRLLTTNQSYDKVLA